MTSLPPERARGEDRESMAQGLVLQRIFPFLQKSMAISLSAPVRS